MSQSSPDSASASAGPPVGFLDRDQLPKLLEALLDAGYAVVGPTIDQGAIVYGEIRSVDDLPMGWTDRQTAGEYRLQRRNDQAYFGYAVGPHSWKQYLFPPRTIVAQADRDGDQWRFESREHDDVPRFAFLGVRACELAAIAVQDRVFLDGPGADDVYRRRRQQALIIAVNCTHPASTCFCTSMQTGPRATSGFDLALTETPTGFIVEVGSEAGRELSLRLPLRTPSSAEIEAAEQARSAAEAQIEKHLNVEGIRDLLLTNLNHPRWDDVADRCLSCTNCTMVCPTCFCSSTTDVSDLFVEHVQRERTWDSCFNFDFSYMNGGPVRNTIRARYRQWLTHKLASWHDQFGVSGCVGCGRCITWCPVGIDLTEEVAAIRETSRETSEEASS